MNRRGFFAAVLAPLVVPWRKYPQEYITVMGPFEVWPRKIDYAYLKQLNARMTTLYNQRIDNIILSQRWQR